MYAYEPGDYLFNWALRAVCIKEILATQDNLCYDLNGKS